MDLNEAQIWILSQLESGKVPELSDFNGLLDEENPLDQKRELAYYIQQLEKNGLIRIGDKAFIFGGDNHPKYDNNVRMIGFDRLLLTTKSIKLVREGNY